MLRFKLTALLSLDLKSLVLFERRHVWESRERERGKGEAINKWVEHSFIGQWQAAQGKSPLRHPAFKTLTHVGTPESLSLMFWLFICFSLYPAKANFSCKTEVHPQHSPCSLLCRSRTLYLGKITAAQCRRYFSLMFFSPLLKMPQGCVLSSLLMSAQVIVSGSASLNLQLTQSLTPTQSCPPRKEKFPLPTALFGSLCCSGAVAWRSLPCWWKQADFRPAWFNGDDISSSALVMVLGRFLKIKSKGTEHYNGDKQKTKGLCWLFFFLEYRNTNHERYRKHMETIQNKISSASVSLIIT